MQKRSHRILRGCWLLIKHYSKSWAFTQQEGEKKGQICKDSITWLAGRNWHIVCVCVCKRVRVRVCVCGWKVTRWGDRHDKAALKRSIVLGCSHWRGNCRLTLSTINVLFASREKPKQCGILRHNHSEIIFRERKKINKKGGQKRVRLCVSVNGRVRVQTVTAGVV